MRKAWVNVGEVEHTSERVRKSVERGVGAEGLRKIVEGLRRVVEWSGNADGSWRSAELSVP